jgi:hypothetical protein
LGKDHAIHPLAETYPPMSEAEMEALVADIAARGLQRPIVLHEGKILDGRNRYLACKKANVEPSFVEYEGDDPLGQVNSLNLNRDLTAAQRAMVAAKQWILNGEKSKGGRPSREKPDENRLVSGRDLAKHHRVSWDYAQHARNLLDEAPDLAAKVIACSLSFVDATKELEKRRADATKQAKDAERATAFSAEYREAISDGRMTLDEALQESFRREAEEREKERAATQARTLWFQQLAKVVEWAKEFVKPHDDEYLAWYTQDDLHDADIPVTREEIDAVIVQLNRIKSITLKESVSGKANGRTKRNQQDCRSTA